MIETESSATDMKDLDKRQEELLEQLWQIELASLTCIHLQSMGPTSTGFEKIPHTDKTKLKINMNMNFLCGTIVDGFKQIEKIRKFAADDTNKPLNKTEIVFIGFLLTLQSLEKEPRETVNTHNYMRDQTPGIITTENVIVCSFNNIYNVYMDAERSKKIMEIVKPETNSEGKNLFVEEDPDKEKFLNEMIKIIMKLFLVYNEDIDWIKQDSCKDVKEFVKDAFDQCKKEVLIILETPYPANGVIFGYRPIVMNKFNLFRREIVECLKNERILDNKRRADATSDTSDSTDAGQLIDDVTNWFNSYIIMRFFGKRLGACLQGTTRDIITILNEQSVLVFPPKDEASSGLESVTRYHENVIFNMLKCIYKLSNTGYEDPSAFMMCKIVDRRIIDVEEFYKFLRKLYGVYKVNMDSLRLSKVTRGLLEVPKRYSQSINYILVRVNGQYAEINSTLETHSSIEHASGDSTESAWQQRGEKLILKDWIKSDDTEYDVPEGFKFDFVDWSDDPARFTRIPGYEDHFKKFFLSQHVLMKGYKEYCEREDTRMDPYFLTRKQYADTVFNELKKNVQTYLGVKIDPNASQLPGDVSLILQNLQHVSTFNNALRHLAKLLSVNYEKMIKPVRMTVDTQYKWHLQFSFFWQVLSCTVLQNDSCEGLTSDTTFQMNILNTLQFKETNVLRREDVRDFIIPYRCFLAVADVFNDYKLVEAIGASRGALFSVFSLRLYIEKRMRLSTFFTRNTSETFTWTGFNPRDETRKNKVEHLLSLILSLSNVSTPVGSGMYVDYSPPTTSRDKDSDQQKTEDIGDFVDVIQSDAPSPMHALIPFQYSYDSIIKYIWEFVNGSNSSSTSPSLSDVRDVTIPPSEPFDLKLVMVLAASGYLIYLYDMYKLGDASVMYILKIVELLKEIVPKGLSNGRVGSELIESSTPRRTMTGNKYKYKEKGSQDHVT